MKRLKSFLRHFRCRRIKADADRGALNRFITKRSDTTRPDFLVGTILRVMRVPSFLSGRYCLLLALYLLLSTCYFAYAGGKIYWTPNGVLLNNFWSSAGSPVDDGKGGAILFSIRPYPINQDSVVALRIDRNGNSLWGLQGKTLDNYAGWQGLVKGVTDGRGGAIAVWTRTLERKLYCQRVDSLGNRMWGLNAVRVTLSDSAQLDHVIASDGKGGVIVVWQEGYYGPGANIYAQRIDSSGVRRWGNYGVPVCTADSEQGYPVITSDDSGNSVIAWVDYRNGEYDIYGQRLNISGVPLWQTNGLPICTYDSAQTFTWGYPFLYGSIVTMLTDTTIGITWIDQRQGNCDIYAQCLRLNGQSLWVSQGVPVCDAVNSQVGGMLIPDDKGGAIFCWVDERNGYKNIYAQRMNSNGQKLWGSQGVPITTSDSAYYYQRIVSDGRSGAIICWQDKRSGNWDVYAQHIDSSGVILWDTNGMPVCTAVNTQEYPEMILSDSNTAIICWADWRSGQARGYAQKVGDDIVGIVEGMRDMGYGIGDAGLKIFPNPFYSSTTIKFEIRNPKSETNSKFQTEDVISSQYPVVSIKIYDVSGRIVRQWDYEAMRQGDQIIWDGRDENNIRVRSGVYFCELVIDNQKVTKKIVFVK